MIYGSCIGNFCGGQLHKGSEQVYEMPVRQIFDALVIFVLFWIISVILEGID